MIYELFKDFQPYHSDFQIIHFILKMSGPTKYGIYKQSLRELDKRYKAIKSLKKQLDENIGNIEEINQSGKDLIREFEIFYRVAVSLKHELGELTDEKRELLEYDLWETSARIEIAKDYHTIGSLSKETLSMLTVMPPSIKTKLFSEINTVKGIENIKKWYLQYEVKLPDYKNIEITDKEVLRCLSYCQ